MTSSDQLFRDIEDIEKQARDKREILFLGVIAKAIVRILHHQEYLVSGIKGGDHGIRSDGCIEQERKTEQTGNEHRSNEDNPDKEDRSC